MLVSCVAAMLHKARHMLSSSFAARHPVSVLVLALMASRCKVAARSSALIIALCRFNVLPKASHHVMTEALSNVPAQ